MSVVTYSYEHAPTIRRFALSNARHRVLIGPFGCLPADTEYLTPRGWKRLDEYKEGDLVAQWDPSTEYVDFVIPERYIKIPATQWVTVSSKTRFSLVMSEDHFMPVDVRLKNIFNRKVMRADEIGKLKGQHKLISTFKTKDRKHNIDSNLIRYAVAVNADGTLPKDSPKAVEFGIHKTRKRDRLIALLESLKLEYRERIYNEERSSSGKYYSIRVINSPYREKTYDTPFWWQMRGGELTIIIDEITHWDGCIKGPPSATLATFSTARESDIGFLQYAAAASGYRSTVGVEPPKLFGRHSPLYVLHFISQNSLKFPVSIRREGYTSTTVDAKRGEYKYCFTMPKGFFVIRQNNVVLISSNSGKSVACCVEIVRKAVNQAPSPVDGIRKTRWAVIRNCYDDQTEILTEKRGWQLFKNLLEDDKVATLDGDDIVYKSFSSVAIFPYKGDMIGFEGEDVNFLVTPDHLMWVSKRRTRKKIWGEFEIIKAQEIYGSQTVRVRRNAKYHGGNTKYSPEMFEFFGFWFAEGYVGKYKRKDCNGFNYRLVVSQTKNIEYISNLLASCGFKYGRVKNKNGYNYSICINDETKKLIEKLLPCGKAITKAIPDWIKNAPVKHLRAFLRGYEKGDGHTKNGANDSTRLFTSSKRLADDLQEIIFKTGGVANLNEDRQEDKTSYRLTILQKKKYYPVLHVNPKLTNKLKGWYKKYYDGFVYCVNMPDVPVYVRRGGRAFWCIRTYLQLKDTTIRTWLDWFPEPHYGVYRVADHIYELTGFDGVRAEIFFRALDRPEQVANLLSLELTGAFMNEAREMPREIWDALDARIGRYPSKRDGGCTWRGIIMDSNPPDETNWLYKLVEEEKPPNVELFKQPGGRTPFAENIPNLDKNYYENLMIGKTPEFIRTYIDGEYGYVMAGDPVYKTSFNQGLHVAKQILEPIKTFPLIPLVSGWDFYLYPSLIIGQYTARGRLLILDEILGKDMGAERFVQTLVDPVMSTTYRGMQLMGFGDPTGNVRAQSDESTCYQILKNNNYHWIKQSYTNSEMARINAVESFLTRLVDGEPAILISPKCKMLIKGFNGGYKRKDNGEIDKNIYSHPHDALQYLCLFALWKYKKPQVNIKNKKAMMRAYALPATTAGY